MIAILERFEGRWARIPYRWRCASIFALAAATRLIYLLAAQPGYHLFHWAIADTLVQHGFIGDEGVRLAAYDPLYPAFLAGARAITGDRTLAVQALQALIDAGGAVGLYYLARVLTNRDRVGLLAGLLYAMYPLLIRHAVVGDEFSLLSTLLIAFAGMAVTASTTARAGAAGVCLGLAILARFMVAPVAVLTAGILAFRWGRRSAGAFLLGTVLIVSPWIARNYALNGSLWPPRSGLNLLHGNSRYTAWVLPEHSTDLLGEHVRDVVARRRPELLRPAAETELDRYYSQLAWDEVTSRPLDAVALAFAKTAYVFWPRLVPTRITTADTRIILEPDGAARIVGAASRPWHDELAYTLSYSLIAAAAVIGIWTRRRELGHDGVLWCVAATFVAASVVYFPATRYRVPMEFVLLFYAAVGLERIAWGRLELTVPPTQA